jgi:hypothetical protein
MPWHLPKLDCGKGYTDPAKQKHTAHTRFKMTLSARSCTYFIGAPLPSQCLTRSKEPFCCQTRSSSLSDTLLLVEHFEGEEKAHYRTHNRTCPKRMAGPMKQDEDEIQPVSIQIV